MALPPATQELLEENNEDNREVDHFVTDVEAELVN